MSGIGWSPRSIGGTKIASTIRRIRSTGAHFQSIHAIHRRRCTRSVALPPCHLPRSGGGFGAWTFFLAFATLLAGLLPGLLLCFGFAPLSDGLAFLRAGCFGAALASRESRRL